GWIPFAVLKGMRVIKKEKIEVIYATGKPWSSFVIALFLKFLTGRPYVLDLRDPWMLTPYDNHGATGLRRRLEGFWERITFSNAKRIINVNRQINDAYIRHYPSIPSGKFAFITHGYDPDDFPGTKRTEAGARFTISYVGTLYSNTSPDNILKAVGSLLSEDPFMKDNIQLKFVGFVPSHVKRMIRDLAIEDVVEIAGCLPHRESIRHMVDSDALLLLLNRVKINAGAQVSTGKLFEYLASRRPILALIPGDTDAAGLINSLGAGRVVDPDNLSGIKEAVCSMYQDYKRGCLKGHSSDIGRFSRKELARQLCAVLG
ncbi:MAG: glycosyltransferase, partial [Deltaproteobacteria bacterium]|nr:glycosyltransferase [Deltaproteobacteria bacterium]